MIAVIIIGYVACACITTTVSFALGTPPRDWHMDLVLGAIWPVTWVMTVLAIVIASLRGSEGRP